MKPAKPTSQHSTAGGKGVWGHLPPELRQIMENTFKEEALDIEDGADQPVLPLRRQRQTVREESEAMARGARRRPGALATASCALALLLCLAARPSRSSLLATRRSRSMVSVNRVEATFPREPPR